MTERLYIRVISLFFADTNFVKITNCWHSFTSLQYTISTRAIFTTISF
jgi:hypothetical protein